MRIALLNSLFPKLGIGGSEMSTFYLAQGLKKLGHTVQVFTQSASAEDVEEIHEGIDVYRCGSPLGHGPNILAEPRLQRMYSANPTKPKSLSSRMAPTILEFQPNIIHTNVIGDLPGFWKLASDYGIPAIHTLRSYTLLCHRRMLRGEAPCVRQCSNCLTSARAEGRGRSDAVTGVVAISKHVMDVHRQAGWFSNVPVRSIIANSYEQMTAETDQQPSGRTYEFGYIGRIHETKGVDIFLEALSAVTTKLGRPIRALIAGDGNPGYVANLRSRYETDAIHFGGYMPQDNFFSRVKFCVVPSVWYEPFGRVFIESLHHGVPVVGSKRGGGAEVLSASTGWLFDPGQRSDLQKALIKASTLSSSRYNAMAKACLKSAESYSVKAIAEAYTDFYLKCLGISK